MHSLLLEIFKSILGGFSLTLSSGQDSLWDSLPGDMNAPIAAPCDEMTLEGVS